MVAHNATHMTKDITTIAKKIKAIDQNIAAIKEGIKIWKDMIPRTRKQKRIDAQESLKNLEIVLGNVQNDKNALWDELDSVLRPDIIQHNLNAMCDAINNHWREPASNMIVALGNHIAANPSGAPNAGGYIKVNFSFKIGQIGEVKQDAQCLIECDKFLRVNTVRISLPGMHDWITIDWVIDYPNGYDKECVFKWRIGYAMRSISIDECMIFAQAIEAAGDIAKVLQTTKWKDDLAGHYKNVIDEHTKE